MLLNPLEIPDWDTQLAAAFPDATVFHTAAWARVLAETYGHRPRCVALARDGREEREEGREVRGQKSEVSRTETAHPVRDRDQRSDVRGKPALRSSQSGGGKSDECDLTSDRCPLTSASVPSSQLPASSFNLLNAGALLPLYEVRSLLTGRRGVCVPFADFCGPLVKAEKRVERRGERGCDSRRENRSAICDLRSAIDEPSLPSPLSSLLQEASSLGREQGWAYLEWRGSWSPPDATPSTVLLSHDLDLRPDESKLQANVESSVRRALRKAERAGLEIEFRTDAAAMDEYYRLHCLTRKKHGLPPQPIRFFRKIHEHLVAKGMGFVALARHGGREKREEGRGGGSVDIESHTPTLSPLSSLPSPHGATGALAGAVFLTFNKKALYKFGASDERFLELRANNLLMWKAFLHCKQIGCTTVGMGRTEKEHEGLRRFKLGWGTVETEVPYFKLDLRKHQWKTESSSPDGWYNRVFRAMPGFMSRWAGQLLYPHLD